MKTTIKFPKNDSFAFFVTINKISKILDNAYFTVKENPDEEPVLQKKLGTGISLADSRLYKNQLSYKVQIDGADTKAMEVGVRYFFDVKGTIGNAQKTFLWGELILSETETGYLNPAIQGDTVAVAHTYTATFETGAQSQYVETEADPVATAQIGSLSGLKTTAKETIVAAVNEVAGKVGTAKSDILLILDGTKKVKKAEQADTVKAKSGSYKELAAALLEMIYPVGSIKLTTANQNPSTYLGGTWVAWGAGRVPVGIDTSDSDFQTVEKKGGEKSHVLTNSEMPSHNHSKQITFANDIKYDNVDPNMGIVGKIGVKQKIEYETKLTSTTNIQKENAAVSSSGSQIGNNIVQYVGVQNDGGYQGHNNLQPYITCYMWKRTA